MAGKKQVVFVSEKNACRSIFAQACALKHGFDDVDANSFGLKPDRIHYLVREVLAEAGFNLTFYFSKAYEVIEHQKFDVVVSMSPAVTEKLPAIPYDFELEQLDFTDPTEKDLPEDDMKKELQELFRMIEKEVKKLVDKWKS